MKIKFSYENGNTEIEFDNSKTTIEEIEKTVNSTEYPIINKKNKMNIELKSTITCPKCGHKKEEEMPTDSCQFFYECEKCKNILKPNEGDCCVYCSFGTVPCPPIQENKKCGDTNCC